MKQPTAADINRSMRAYYEERAGEYELIYSGGHPASINRPVLFTHDAAAVAALLPGLVGKAHLDLACGTGYWLSFYQHSCDRIVLVDQSAAMLAECRRHTAAAGIGGKTVFVRTDVLAFQPEPRSFDSVFMGFLWSHLTEQEEADLFALVKDWLAPGGRFIILDSAWTPERAAARDKSSIQTRTLVDGQSFLVRKHYLDRDELGRMEKKYAMTFGVRFSGKAFLLAEGRFS